MQRVDSAPEAASPAAEGNIDRICDLFEAELKAGRRPDLGRIVDQVPPESREALLVELVLVGLEYTGTSPYREAKSDTTKPDQRSRRPEATRRTLPCSEDLRATESAGDPAAGPGLPVPPRTIGGYELLNELGRGGMGVVYRARQVNIDRIVALKIIRGSRFEHSDDVRCTVLLERFRIEAIAASRLDHENIATVYDIGQFGDDPYYAMRLIEGPSLDKLVQAGPLPVDQAVRYLVPIARTIARLHSIGVVHRDLKPSNILIEEASDTPVLTDFGLAKLIDAQQNVTLSDEGFGSPPYMAPEQVLHATSVTGAADIYSLGATLYHLLTGRPPFQADSLPEFARQIVFCDPIPPRQLDSSIPRDLETICLKCLEKDEPRRYASASDLANDLQRFLDHRPIIARPIGSIGRIWRWSRRNPAWVILVISVIVLLSASVVTFTFMHVRQQFTTAVAERALADNRLTLSNELFDKSQFTQGGDLHEALPWLIACLGQDADTPRERATRQRIHSVLHHGPDLTRLYCHDGPISCGAFSPRGDRVLTGSTDRTARVWSTKTGECLYVLQHKAPVRQAVFNHRGNLAVTAADDGTVQLWTVESGQKFAKALAHPGHVRFAIFSADDEFLVTVSADELVRVWSARDGSLHTTIVAADAGPPISCLALSPDGIRGVSCAGNSRARVWNLRTGEFSPFELEHSDAVTTVQFSPDATAIVTGGDDGTARIWDAHSGRLLREFMHRKAVKQVCFAADSKRVITATDDAAYVWSLESTQPSAHTFAHAGIKAITVDSTNTSLLTVGDDRTAKMWNLQDGKSLDAAFLHAGDVAGAQFSVDGGSVLTFSADGAARTWNRIDGRQKCRIAALPDVLLAKATPDRQWILAWASAGVGAVFRADAPDAGCAIFEHSDNTAAACISPDGRRVAVADTKGELSVWDRETGQAVAKLRQNGIVVRALEFSPDGKTLAMGDTEGNVALCNVETGDIPKTFKLTSGVINVAFSPRGDFLLATDSNAARLSQLGPTDAPDTQPMELGGDIRGARFSPDGRFIVIYGAANRVLVWDIVGGSCKVLHTGSPVNDVSFTRNSSKLLTVAQDGTAQAWRVVDGSPIHQPMKYHAPLTMGSFSPDGQSVALCGDDRTLRVWHLDSARPITIRLRHVGRIVHAQFVAPHQLLTVTEHGDVYAADVVPATNGIEELKAISMVHCGHVIDSAGALVPLPYPEFMRRCREINDRPDQ